MKRREIFALITAERRRQNAKWIRPHGWLDDNFIKHTVLGEEVGEVAQEVSRLHAEDPRASEATLRDELVQVAAVCVAWLEMLS